MSDDEGHGLRERKRLATRRAILTALLELALERGYDRVTIEDVCRAADVSPRTFFNYFTSKDDAVSGSDRRFEPSEEQRAAFVEHEGDPLGDLVALMADIAPQGEDIAVHRLRRELMHREPRLLAMGLSGARRMEEATEALLLARLVREADREGVVDEEAAVDRARLLALVGTAVVRHGWASWVRADGSRSLPDCLRAAWSQFADQWPAPDRSAWPAERRSVPVPT